MLQVDTHEMPVGIYRWRSRNLRNRTQALKESVPCRNTHFHCSSPSLSPLFLPICSHFLLFPQAFHAIQVHPPVLAAVPQASFPSQDTSWPSKSQPSLQQSPLSPPASGLRLRFSSSLPSSHALLLCLTKAFAPSVSPISSLSVSGLSTLPHFPLAGTAGTLYACSWFVCCAPSSRAWLQQGMDGMKEGSSGACCACSLLRKAGNRHCQDQGWLKEKLPRSRADWANQLSTVLCNSESHWAAQSKPGSKDTLGRWRCAHQPFFISVLPCRVTLSFLLFKNDFRLQPGKTHRFEFKSSSGSFGETHYKE